MTGLEQEISRWGSLERDLLRARLGASNLEVESVEEMTGVFSTDMSRLLGRFV